MTPTSAASVGVVIPVHDGERYLAEAIASAAGQLPPPAAVVVVDDGSTDRSADLADGWGGPVRCVRQAHAGAAAARNRGVAELDTEFVALLDADDVWTAGALAVRLAVLLERSDLGIVYGAVEAFFSPDLPTERRARLRPPEGPRPALLPGSALIRRRLFAQVGGFDTSLAVGEFIDWCLRARAAGVQVHALPDVVLRRRIHDANLGILRRDAAGDYLRVVRGALARGARNDGPEG